MSSNTIVIDPVTRIEGHLRVELDVANGAVTNARNVAALYRGFENIVLNRDPRDAPPILSAIGGVCHSDHHYNGVRCIENAAGLTQYTNSYADETTVLSKNTVLARNVVGAADWAYSHAVHIVALAGPDYKLYGLLEALSQSHVVNNYAVLLRIVAIPVQAYMHRIITLWGGKAPHQRGAIPDGMPVRPSADVIVQTKARISNARSLLDVAAPAIWNYFTSNAVQLSQLGPGTGNFVSMGQFQDPTTSGGTTNMPLTISRGVITYPNTTPDPFDPTKTTEAVSESWYDQTAVMSVASEPPPKPDMTSSSAYSWAKSPRYGGSCTESGPLAREYVTGIYPKLGKIIYSINSSVPGLPLNPKGSMFDRMVARALELVALIGSNNTTKNLSVLGQPLTLSLVDILTTLGLPTNGLMETWLDSMDAGASVYTSAYKNPDSATGIGLWEAPRGSLFHWVKIEGGKINDYQVIASTTWNVPPNEPLEQGLVGTLVGNTGTDSDLLQVAYVIRSYDLCLACTVHYVDARGSDRYFKAV